MNVSADEAVVAAFDFDGTLTTRDTLLAFIRFTHGRRGLLGGLLRYAPCLLLMRMGLYPNWKAKERFFSHFYRGVPHRRFMQWGRQFAGVAMTMLNGRMVEMLHRHQAEGHTVCVVTASIDEWVRPVCDRLGIRVLLATHIEVSPDGNLTGRFLSPNCYGSEKVERLLEAFPHRATYKLYAYGNGRGDRELLALADEAFLVSGRRHYFLFLYTKFCTRRNKG